MQTTSERNSTAMTTESSTPRTSVAEDSIPSARTPVGRLSGKQRKWLRGRAHHLAAVVRVGHSGTTEAVLREVDHALEVHELIKVRCYRPEAKRQWATDLARATGAELCGLIGHTAILYRPRREGPSPLAQELARVSNA